MTINIIYEAPSFGQSWWKKFGITIAGMAGDLIDDARRCGSRLAKASLEGREKRTDAEISRFIQRTGGFLTDRIEREIERALLKP